MGKSAASLVTEKKGRMGNGIGESSSSSGLRRALSESSPLRIGGMATGGSKPYTPVWGPEFLGATRSLTEPDAFSDRSVPASGTWELPQLAITLGTTPEWGRPKPVQSKIGFSRKPCGGYWSG